MRDWNNNKVVYQVMYGGFTAAYFGETAKNKEKDSQANDNQSHHRISVSLVMHVEDYIHLAVWNVIEIFMQV